MAIFAIYQFRIAKFKKLEQRLNFSEEKKSEVLYETDEELLESLFPKQGGSISIATLKDKGKRNMIIKEIEKHDNRVEQKKDHIIVFRLQANQTRKINHEDWTFDKVGHHPDCRIILDCRRGSGLMVIEKKVSVFEPDEACNLICNAINNTLKDYGRSIKFERLEKSSDFWKGVNEIREKFHDSVKRVQFDFVGDKEQQSPATDLASRLTEWAGLLAARASLSWEMENDEVLKKVEGDLTRMSELCYKNSNYNLNVKFRDFGLYRYGQDIQAQLGLEDEIIDKFVLPAKNQDLFDPGDREGSMLAEWFDRINVLFEDYGKDVPVQSNRVEGDRV